MALTARIERTRPDTLPADFNEWDSVEVPVTLPEDFSEFDAGPHEQGAGEAPGRLEEERINETIEAGSAPEPAPHAQAPIVKEAPSQIADLSSGTNQISATEQEPKGPSRLKIVAIASVLALVLLGLIALVYVRLEVAAVNPHQSIGVQPQPKTESQTKMPGMLPTNATKPPAGVPVTPPPSASSVMAPPVQSQEVQVQPDSMNTQLNAPARLPRNLQRESDPETAPGTSVIEGFGGSSTEAVNGVFGTRKSPQVKPDARPIAISAGVAEGRLIRKALPVYPQIAKNARVSGTVVLNAVISKGGIPQGVHAVSGPSMLRQAATDAVNTWRYKPYLLNNEPVEVETTINVIFSVNQ